MKTTAVNKKWTEKSVAHKTTSQTQQERREDTMKGYKICCCKRCCLV
jgi:hypothetical protein